MRKEIEKYDSLREAIINQSRLLLKTSKVMIYSIHRGKGVEDALKEVKKEKKKLIEISKKHKRLPFEPSYSDGMQEYAEAIGYYYYVKNKKLISPKKMGVTVNDYMMGLCDLTGELGRRAVMAAIRKEKKEVKDIREFVDKIYYEFLKFNLRNGKIRKKSDAIKWNLKKIEEVLYDISK